MNSTREELIEFALGFSGASADGKNSDEYLTLLSRDAESAQTRKDMGKMSSCALFVRAVWWWLGLEHEIYTRPYRTGYAPIDVVRIGKDHGAYIPGYKLSNQTYPKAGDAFYIATKDGKREHFGIVTKELLIQPGTFKYETVEGGQGPGGRTIEKLTRSIFKTKEMYPSIGDRLLLAWFDCDSLKLPGLRSDPSK